MPASAEAYCRNLRQRGVDPASASGNEERNLSLLQPFRQGCPIVNHHIGKIEQTGVEIRPLRRVRPYTDDEIGMVSRHIARSLENQRQAIALVIDLLGHEALLRGFG